MIANINHVNNREAAELARNAATEEAKANALTGGKVKIINIETWVKIFIIIAPLKIIIIETGIKIYVFQHSLWIYWWA